MNTTLRSLLAAALALGLIPHGAAFAQSALLHGIA